MRIKKSIVLGLSVTLLNVVCLAQEKGLMINMNQEFGHNKSELNNYLKIKPIKSVSTLSFFSKEDMIMAEGGYIQNNFSPIKLNDFSILSLNQTEFDLELQEDKTVPFIKNRRNLYSSMWAFASLNYIYADVISLMDKNTLTQYQSGVVNGINITPNFLAYAAVFMQVPLANVFLPHVIKNDKTLRWVQIASGTLMTLVQASTLFVGKPSPHYAVFSTFEIAATTFITIDAIKWKPKSNKKALKY